MRLLPLTLLALPALAFAQGQLTPPADAFLGGAPKASMRSLDQLEPRLPLGQIGTNGLLTITQPGSYVLMGNVAVTAGDGITIAADDVTLDLNGFTLSSSISPASGTAVRILGEHQNIVVRNGHIRGSLKVDLSDASMSGSGFQNGVYCYQAALNCLVTDLTVNGVSSHGIYLDGGSTIDRCVVSNCGGKGIVGQVVSNSSATACGERGIVGTTVGNSQGTAVISIGIEASTAINCTGQTTAVDSGIGLKANLATNCSGFSPAGIGLWALRSATNCYGATNSGAYALKVESEDSTPILGSAENCQGRTAGGGHGLLAGTATNCTGTSGSGFGLQADTATGCTGTTTSGQRGLYIIGTATNCRGKNPATGGVALSATIAVACTAESGSILVINRYNMP